MEVLGGVTVNNNWMYNNPDLDYPEGHESMSESELREALRVDFDYEPQALAADKQWMEML